MYSSGHFTDLVTIRLPSRVHKGPTWVKGNLPVSSKLSDRIHCWEFIDMGKLLPEVTEREEPENLPWKRPCCVTDIWSWLHTLFQDVHINCGDYNSIEMIVQKS